MFDSGVETSTTQRQNQGCKYVISYLCISRISFLLLVPLFIYFKYVSIVVVTSRKLLYRNL